MAQIEKGDGYTIEGASDFETLGEAALCGTVIIRFPWKTLTSIAAKVSDDGKLIAVFDERFEINKLDA